MEPVRTIVAATDFSPEAFQATQRAALLAREHQAQLRLVHVVEPDALLALRDLLTTQRDLQERVAEQAGMELSATAAALRDTHGVAAEEMLRVGDTLQELSQVQAQGDLLVLGARGGHGAPALRKLATGSTVDRLLRTSRRPTLVVKAAPGSAYRQALVLVDLTDVSACALEAVARIAPTADLTLLHAFEVPYEGKLRVAGVAEEEILDYRSQARARAVAGVEQLASSPGLRDRCAAVVRNGDIRTELRRALDELGPDLVVVAKQSRSTLIDLFLGSVTRAALAEAACDVLVVPPARA